MLRTLRYVIELLAMPIFALLAVHLAGAGIASLAHPDAHTNHTHDHSHGAGMFDLAELLSTTGLTGLVLVAGFVWIWHRPVLKKWVPCAHDHCHHTQSFSHLMATVALCVHFFPEAEVRHALLAHDHKHMGDILGLVGFASHFVVDVIVAVLISSYWPKAWQFWASLLVIAAVWVGTALLAHHSAHYSDLFTSGSVLLFSSFLLSMFIHKPHKPVTPCHSCDD